MAEGWTTVNRSSLRSRLQEAEERLSQALSQINVLEAQVSCLRAEQSQLTKSHEHHVSLLREEIRELKTKHKKLLAHQEIECEKAGLESTIVPEHIPEELIQLIQSHLPVKEAARTTVLSKSWQHAWSTNPTLRFRVRGKKSMKLVDRTLKRYLRDNISIEKLDLKIDTMNWKPASRAEKCILPVATKTWLKEFSLLVTFHDWDSHFMLPDELLLGEKLTKIRVQGAGRREDNCVKMMTSLHPVIKCVSLQELHLNRVDISEESLNHILSSCTLLVKVELINLDSWSWIGFKKTIKVKNLPRLQELHIAFNTWYSPALEISDVPNLHVFRYNINGYGRYPSDWYLMVPDRLPFNANAHSMSLSNVRELELGGVVPNYACLDMITSERPFLESLTLDLETWELESFHFTCASIKRISLVSHVHNDPSDVQIFAPKLLSFSFTGYGILPNLLFPVSSLRKIELSLSVGRFVPHVSFFVKMREALTLAPKCNICIRTHEMSFLGFNIIDLRRRLLFPPATNVQQLDFQICDDKCLLERSPFFDAFFEICHPKHVIAQIDYNYFPISPREVLEKNHFCKLMLREVLEKKKTTGFWPDHLKHVLVRLLPHEKWETITISNGIILAGSAPAYFKLEWV